MKASGMTLSANTASWTSADYQSATAANIAALTTAQVAALAHVDWLTPAAFGGFSAAQVAAVSISWYWMSAAQINALSATAVTGIPASGIAALTTTAVAGLNPAHIAALLPAQIGALTGSQVAALSATQIGALTPQQIPALTTSQLALLSAAQIGGLGKAQVAALSLTQLGSLSATQLAGLSAAAAGGLTTAQLAAMGMGISGLTPTAIAGLAPAVVGALTGWQLADLTEPQVAALTNAQLATLTAARIGYLSAGQLQALGTHVQALGNATLGGLATTNLLAIYTRLSSAQLGALSAVQLAVVKVAQGKTTALLSSLTAGGLLNPVKALVGSGQSLFSYQGVLGVLQGMTIGSSGLTAAQFTDLKALTSAVGAVDGSGSYLFGELAALVNGNAANAQWTGGATSSVALGNLAVGTSAAHFSELIGKWFLGTDLPTWLSTSATTWTAKAGDLFSTGGPTSADPRQGGIGDCYLIAATLDVALDQPGLIASMFTDNGNGTYGVRMYAPDGSPLYFTVNDQLPNGGRTAGTASGAQWVTLLEKAFVAWDNEVYGSANAYASINGGWDEGLTAITGKADTNYLAAWTSSQSDWDTTVKNAVLAALKSGEEVLFGSFIDDKDAGNGKRDLVSDHEFAVTGFDKTTGDFILQNPWGASGGGSWNGIFEQSIDQLWGGLTGNSSYSGFIVANGNSPAGATAPAYAASQLAHAIASSAAHGGSLALDSHSLAAMQGSASADGLHLAAALRA